MSETKSELGIPLRGLRSQKGSTLNKIKNGQMSPSCDALQKLAAGFAVNANANANAEGSPHAIL